MCDLKNFFNLKHTCGMHDQPFLVEGVARSLPQWMVAGSIISLKFYIKGLQILFKIVLRESWLFTTCGGAWHSDVYT